MPDPEAGPAEKLARAGAGRHRGAGTAPAHAGAAGRQRLGIWRAERHAARRSAPDPASSVVRAESAFVPGRRLEVDPGWPPLPVRRSSVARTVATAGAARRVHRR
jgi:hypothetical protein